MTERALAALRGRSIVFLASIDWDAAWQRHHALASAFARAGAHVLFVENSGFRNPRLADARRVLRRLAAILLGRASWRRAHPLPAGVRVAAPLALPPTHALFRLLNRYWLLPSFARSIRRRGIGEAVAVCYIPTQTTLDLLSLFWPRLVVYDVVDHFHGHPDPPRDLARTEGELLRASDLVFTTSPLLQRLHEPRHPHVLRVHHGVSEDFFLAPPQAPRAHRRLAYFGTLREGLDYAAINALAEAGFPVSLLGPEKDSPPPLHPAVRRTGMLSTGELTRELAAADALLLPYEDTEWNKGITPAKIFECFATGRPVVASEMPGLAEFRRFLYTASGPEGFVTAVRNLDREETAARAAERVAEARRHSASAQFALIAGRIQEALRRPRLGALEKAPILRLPHTLQGILRGLTWITLFFSGAKLLTLCAHIGAARLLGPEAYGGAHLILATAALLQILPMLGFPLALAHFAPAQASHEQRRLLMSTTLSAFALWSASSLWLLIASRERWSAFVGLSPSDAPLALLLAFLTAGHLTASSGLQGLTWFRRRGFAEALYGLGAAALLGLLAATGERGANAFVHSLCGGLAAATAYSVWALRSFLRPAFDGALARAVFPYAAVGALNVLAAALILAPGRLTLYYAGSAEQVGIFSAYFTATVQVALAFITMAATVLVPLTSVPQGQSEAWLLLRRLAPRIWAGGFVAFAGTGAAALGLVGRSYGFHPGWLALFAAAGACVLTHGLFAALYAGRGLGGMAVSAGGAALAGFGNLAFNLLLTPRFGIAGAAFSLLLGYALGIAWYYRMRPSAEQLS